MPKYAHGLFTWADLQTTDGPAATAFYTQLFGWTALEIPLPFGGVYAMLQQDGKDIVGLGEMQPEQKEQGMPAFWTSYINVHNIDTVLADVPNHGGTPLSPAMDVMDSGRLAVIQDPTGATVGLWEPKNHIGAKLFNAPNSMAWNELSTRSPELARKFYSGLLGWTHETDENNYTMWLNDGRMNGGMIKMDENWPAESPAHWMMYIAVADTAAIAAKAAELGGVVHLEPFPAGEVGMVTLLADPQGAMFYAIQMNSMDGMPELVD